MAQSSAPNSSFSAQHTRHGAMTTYTGPDILTQLERARRPGQPRSANHRYVPLKKELEEAILSLPELGDEGEIREEDKISSSDRRHSKSVSGFISHSAPHETTPRTANDTTQESGTEGRRAKKKPARGARDSVDELFSASGDQTSINPNQTDMNFDFEAFGQTELSRIFADSASLKVEVMIKYRLLPIAQLFAQHGLFAKSDLYNSYKGARDVYNFAHANSASDALRGRCAFYVALTEFILSSEGLRSPPPISWQTQQDSAGQIYFEEALQAREVYDEGKWAEDWLKNIRNDVAGTLSPRSQNVATKQGYDAGILGRAFNAFASGLLGGRSEPREVTLNRKAAFLQRGIAGPRQTSPPKVPERIGSYTSWGSGNVSLTGKDDDQFDPKEIYSLSQSFGNDGPDLPHLEGSRRIYTVTNPDPPSIDGS